MEKSIGMAKLVGGEQISPSIPKYDPKVDSHERPTQLIKYRRNIDT